MTLFEIITSVISIVALVVSVVSLVRTRKNQEKLLEFEEVHAALSKHQLEEIKIQDALKLKANISVSLEGYTSDFKFYIENNGPASAREIRFSLINELEHNPLVSGDFEGKLKYPSLEPGDCYYLLASFPISVTQNIYEVELRWVNEDGTNATKVFTVSR